MNMNEGIETHKEPQIEQFGDVDFNDESAPQRNDLGVGSAEESLGAQPTEGDPMNEENVEAPPMADPPQIELVEIFKRNLYRDEDLFNSMKTRGQGNSLSIVKLVNFYAGKLEKYNDSIQNERPARQKKKASAASRTDGKQLAAYTTLLESWIFAHIPKLPGIAKEQYSDASEYCTRWKWILSITDRTGARDLLKYRKAFDNYKVEDVVWDPYRAERRFDHDINENTFFKGLTSSPDHVEPIDPNRIVRQFAMIQPIPKSPKCVEVSGLRTWDGEEPKQYKPKYDWVDVFSKGLWKEWIVRSRDRGRRLRGGPAQCFVVIPKGEPVPSRDLHKKIDELTIKYEDAVKRLKEKESFGELAEKDDPIFIELFDQYDRFYTIAQQGPKGDYQEDFTVMGGNQDKLMEVRRANVVLKKKINETLFQLYVKYHLDVRGVQGEDGNSAFRVPTIIKHQSQNQFMKVINLLGSLMAKDPAFWKTVFSQSLDTSFSSRGEMVYEQLRRACSYGGQHVEYRHMRHLLATCYEKVVVLSAIIRHTHSYLYFGLGKTITY
ncbi:hypothetical protein GIB67_010950 [Kingdonia uniflora]|uniref:Aminotransferase-like plant mobile domain-containing protein n=1 Tax=Kingdonia uniflora TaxID=39325 RepID=A0A7J7NVQ9_9MAGN|nr:hypothetical protein GIB67_010950 [Kingdonia uniflora]